MTDFQQLLVDVAGNPVLQTLVLFIGPFVLEEAALVAGAALAAAGELPAPVALVALFLGMMVSDWMLYALGRMASRSRRVREWIGDSNLAFGRSFLEGSIWSAGLTARLVPWMLLAIFVASGFLRVGFLRFVLVNGLIALVYTNALFWALYVFDLLLFEYLDSWGWAVMALLVVALLLLGRRIARRIAHKRPTAP